MSEWFSVKEKLPTKENTTIVCLINNHPILCDVHDVTFNLTTYQVSFYWPRKEWIKDKYFAEVTHWMPLPYPPKEKKDE